MKKVALIILDWFWINIKNKQENAIFLAKTPTFDKLFKTNNFSSLIASWKAVWLEEWIMWNSEVWHLTIWAWKIIKQSIVTINDLFEERKFEKLASFQKLINRENKIHIAWMLWNTWIHSNQKHFYEIIKIIPRNIKISLHLFSDWRDSWIKQSLEFLDELLLFLKDYKNVEISSISWRFFAMDRDNNLERTKQSFDVIIWNTKNTTLDIREYIKKSYENNIFDEFIEPVSFTNTDFLKKNEKFVFLNFRPDRAKQLTQMICQNFSYENIFTMTKYSQDCDINIFLEKEEVKDTLWEILSKNWLKQLHLAETEKFAHVTKFFNWWKNIKFEWEIQILIPSKKVKSYEETPEMSAFEILDTFKKESSKYDFSVVNFANWDMVWHSWNLQATIKAIETLDEIVWKLIDFCDKENIELLITADHWNCENMWNKNNPCTTHTLNPVPFFYIKNKEVMSVKPNWDLTNIAPTILKIMWIEKQKDMSCDLL